MNAVLQISPEVTKGVSVVVPVYNEEENVAACYTELTGVLQTMGLPYEIIFVDDGSKDRTVQILRDTASADPHVKVIEFRRNFGQTQAMSAGFEYSRYDVVVPIDGDLQNDPAEIPMMVAKLDEGYDVVAGWRKDRQDTFWNRKLPSMIANWLISKVTKVSLHDYGCSLKVLRGDIARGLRLYGEMHRFIPALAFEMGARVTEVPVNHRARQFGRTKYGISRTFRVILDLLTVKFLLSYSTRPIQVFGRFGLVFGGLALAVLAALGLDRLTGPWGGSEYLVKRPFWVITPLMFLGFALQFLIMGLLAELMTRTYHESQDKPIYTVREIVTSETA